MLPLDNFLEFFELKLIHALPEVLRKCEGGVGIIVCVVLEYRIGVRYL